jgi:hypothetical protein
MPDTIYRPVISAEASGLRRQFVARVSANWAVTERTFKSSAVRWAAMKVARGGKDRHEARKVLLKAFAPVATLVSSDPLIWTVCRVIESPFRAVDRLLTHDEQQDGVALYYVATAPAPQTLAMQTRCIVATMHALGRFYMRGGVDLDEALREAERSILAAPDRCAVQMMTASEVWVKGGPGRWRCSFVAPPAHDTGRVTFIGRLRTWYSEGMIPEDEIAVSDRLLTPEPGDRSLGEYVLNPLMMRRKA